MKKLLENEKWDEVFYSTGLYPSFIFDYIQYIRILIASAS